MKTYNLKTPVLFPLSVAVALLMISFVVIFYRFQERHLMNEITTKLESVQKLFRGQLESDAGMLGTAADMILRDKNVVAALRAGNSRRLFDLTRELFTELRADHGITHLYFTGNDRINVLRVHHPERHGDEIDRYTTLEAEKTGKTAYGIELGPLGTFTLRVVEPCYDGEQLIGYVELGEEIHHITRKLHNILGVEIYVVIQKEYLDRHGWETGMRMLGRTAKWDQFPSVVMIDQTQDVFPEALAEYLAEKKHTSMVTDVETPVNDQRFRTRFIPIEDAGNRSVGDMIVMTDVTGLMSDLRRTAFTVSAIAVAVGGSLFVLFYLFIGRVEQQMEESGAELIRIRKAVESTSDAIIMVDMSGKATYQNKASLGLFGYALEELNAAGGTSILYADPGVVGEILDAVRGGNSWQGQTEIRTQAQEPLWVALRADAIWGKAGDIVELITIHTDISKRKRLEAEIQQMRKLEALGTLAGGIAHDFNNLLMGIQGNVSLMLLNKDETYPEYKRLRDIEKQIESGAKLTSHLLGYARKGRYEVRPLDLNQLVEDTCETFGRTRKNINIHQDLARDLFAIEADPAQIEQVLWNLYVNAADAMPEGGSLMLKTVNTGHENMKGRLYVPKPGRYVRLTISDTGVGMDRKTMDCVFDPFFTTKEMGRGTGLGLASAYGIVKAHGGYIDVDSRKSEGTTFSIYLPVSEKKIRKQAAPAEKFFTGTGTVLLVDDEEAVLKVSRELLEALGYRVLVATRGKQAVEVYSRNRNDINIVILDMIMPDMSGGEAYDQLKKMNPEIKVLLSSGYSIEGQATTILDRGCDGFIQKPFTMEALSKKIKTILEKK